MKKKPNRVAPSTPVRSFVDSLVAADEMRERFYMTPIDQALRKAINECRLFVMPEGFVFAYHRGSGPVGMAKVSAGAYEGTVDAIKPLPLRSLTLTYKVSLISEDEGEKEEHVRVSLPHRFTAQFHEEQDPRLDFPKLKANFRYNATELNTWIAEQQMIVYARAESELHEEVARLKARIKHINENSRKSKPYAPSQSGF